MPARVAAAISALILLAACSSAPAPTLPSTPFPTPAPVSTPAPTPTQPPTQPPTPSVHPTPTSSPTVAPIPSTGGAPAPLAISADQIGAHLDALQAIADANDGIRAAGTPGYDGSASYVADQLTQMGYRVERDPFAFTFYDEAAPVTL